MGLEKGGVEMFFDKKSEILVTGGAGFLGQHVRAVLRRHGFESVSIVRSRHFDLTTKEGCEGALGSLGREWGRWKMVIHLAGVVGGIGFNQQNPGILVYKNLLMGMQLMEVARLAGVEKFVTIGTVCAYPKHTPVPFKEENLWNGYPEETNAPYGVAKRALLEMGQAYRRQYGMNIIYLLPVNLYGPGDNFNPDSSHVIPALIRKVAEAQKEKRSFIEVWGTGNATREFLYVEDAANGIVLAMMHYDKPEPVNLGSGMEISINGLVHKICVMMDFKGEIRWNISKPDGQPRRCLDVSRAEQEFGFKAKTSFDEGLQKTIEWYRIKENP